MLVLTRRMNESIWIGDDIIVTIVGIKESTGQVRIGISAPKDVRIDREEVRSRILASRREERGR